MECSYRLLTNTVQALLVYSGTGSNTWVFRMCAQANSQMMRSYRLLTNTVQALLLYSGIGSNTAFSECVLKRTAK